MIARRLHLNAGIYGLGSHVPTRHLPESDPFSIMTLDYWADIGRRAEAGCFDIFFLGDILALQEGTDKTSPTLWVHSLSSQRWLSSPHAWA